MELALFTGVPFVLAFALATPFLRQTLNKSAQTYLTAIVMGVLFFGFLSFFPQIQENPVVQTIDWVPSLGISLSFYLDGLSMMFALIVSGIGALIFFYAGFYFDEPEEHNRFIVWLLGFAGAMLGVVLSGNLLMTFIAWELTSITSFMLIGFKGNKYADAREGAFRALFITGGGALALIIGLAMMSAAAGQVLYPDEGLRFVADIETLLTAKDLYKHDWYTAFTILIVIGAFTKSAQFPFHFWLPGAMSAPTPASAYLHSATMVKAGIFLVARLSPVMYQNELWSQILVSFGLLTMLIGAVFAIKQRDLKGLLAYSTISKLGAIVAMIGLPDQSGLKAAFVGIIAHALYKSALFLVAGTIDHATGTRIIDKLGGLRKQMPAMHIVTVISALSMAGVPFFLGFLAKETLIDAMLNYSAPNTAVILGVTVISSIFTALAGYMLIYDVFWKEPTEEIHFHKPANLIRFSPLVLSLGSLSLGLLLDPVLLPLLEVAVPKEFVLYLFAGFNDIFFISMGIIFAGLALFFVRNQLIKIIYFPLSANSVYNELLRYIDWMGDTVLKTQSGYLRYYLAIILGTVATVIIASGTLTTVAGSQPIFPSDLSVTNTELSKIFMLLLTIVVAFFTVFVREHVKAAIAYGVFGYAIATIFLIEPAPDVALVQLLVETMATVLIIIMLGRISSENRRKAMERLWQGRHRHNFGLLRDLTISIIIGLAVFVFSLTALQNRPERQTISQWHLENTAATGVDDVVGAIVAKFRGTDTFVEIIVFAAAGLGVLTLLSRGRRDDELGLVPNPDNIKKFDEFSDDAVEEIQDATNLSTPFTTSVSYAVLPIAILIGIAQILYGSNGPGDGFTAGVTIGLAVSLWYVVLGYVEAKRQLSWFNPAFILRFGLVVAIVNAIFPIFVGGNFMGLFEIDKALGLYDVVGAFGLHITTALIFEISIALTVMGGIGLIMEAIAHPKEVQKFTDE